MKFVFISDTHGQHDKLYIPEGDVLIHCGDFTKRGKYGQFIEFNSFLSHLNHRIKICIAGNHDKLACSEFGVAQALLSNAKLITHNVFDIDGIKCFGTSFVPPCGKWSFGIENPLNRYYRFSNIPDDTEILVSHGHPEGIKDDTFKGDDMLLKRVRELKHLKVHVYGHNHDGYGIYDKYGIKFVNCCVCDSGNNIVNKPIVLEI